MIVTVLFAISIFFAVLSYVPGMPFPPVPFVIVSVIMLYFMIHPIAGLG